MKPTSDIDANAKTGSVVVIGTGIRLGHISLESQRLIAKSDKVFYCVADAATEAYILKVNPSAESLYEFYGENKERRETYDEMIQCIMKGVHQGLNVCAVFYGHPGIFVDPSHEVIKLARAEGYAATMLPATSSLDCLFADLGVDPALGCQIFEATDLVLRRRAIDIFAPVIVWQIAATGDTGFSFKGYNCRNVPILTAYLLQYYEPEFEVTVYEASHYLLCEPIIQRVRLSELPSADISGVSTLYIPRKERAPIYLEMVEKLGLGVLLEGKRLVPIRNEILTPSGLKAVQDQPTPECTTVSK